jgi:hypothetical protein
MTNQYQIVKVTSKTSHPLYYVEAYDPKLHSWSTYGWAYEAFEDAKKFYDSLLDVPKREVIWP